MRPEKRFLFFFNRACFGEFLLPTTLFRNNSDWKMNLKSGSTKLRHLNWKQILVALLAFCVLCMQMDKHRKAGANWEAPSHKWKQLKTQTFIFFMGRKNKQCLEGRSLMNFQSQNSFFDKISSPTALHPAPWLSFELDYKYRKSFELDCISLSLLLGSSEVVKVLKIKRAVAQFKLQKFTSVVI